MIKLVLLDIDGVITDGNVYINDQYEETKRINFKDIDAIFELKSELNYIGMITGEKSEIVQYFNKRFAPDYFFSGQKNKLDIIKQIQRDVNLNTSEICYIGDGKSDIEAIKYVGLGVCPNDAIEEAKMNADVVLNSNAGCGAIYELVKVIRAYNKDQDLIKDFGYRDDIFDKVYDEHAKVFTALGNDQHLRRNVLSAACIITESLKAGHKVLICGNGGSAADAQHIATELVSKFYLERKALNVEALACNMSTITAISNDYSFEKVFSRQVEAKGRPGDVLIGISTSGKSGNVLEALTLAKQMNIKTILLTGAKGNKSVQTFSDIVISVPSLLTPRIQEIHIFIGHLICEVVEQELFGEKEGDDCKNQESSKLL